MWDKLKHQITLHVIIFIWGFTAILGKFIEADAFVLVWYRVVLAFVSLALFLLLLSKPMRIASLRQSLVVLGVGGVVALHWLFFYLAIKLSTASLAIICLSTATLHVAWLEPIIRKRKPLRSEFILGILIIGGILLITFKGSAEPINAWALFFGLLSAFLAALFSTLNARLVQSISSSKITLYEMFSATLFMTVVLFFMGELSLDYLTISWSDFVLLLFLGIVCTSVAFLVTVEITKFLGAFTVSLSINMEPIYTLGLAAWLLKEHQALNLSFYLGATIIVGAVFGNALLKYYHSRKLKKFSQS